MAEQACEETFWLTSAYLLLEPADLDDIATAVEKVATAFVAKKAAGIPIAYATAYIGPGLARARNQIANRRVRLWWCSS